jgi:hypothetical protein
MREIEIFHKDEKVGKSKPVRHFPSKFYGTMKINRKKNKKFPTAK